MPRTPARRGYHYGVESDRIARRVVVHGHVQGVFFRDSTRRMAAQRGVVGWVTNHPDGAVEALLEGSAPDVEAVIEFCRRGPRGAQVARVEVSETPPSGQTRFEVR